MEEKIFAKNRKAYHDYHIEETYEAGIVLTGTEVKSIRSGRINLKDSYARIENSEVFVLNMHISPYEQGNRFNHEPLRKRKLLMHRREISRLIGLTREKGYTLIPTQVYAQQGLIKIEIALARGKRQYDKREALAEKEAKREVERAFKEKNQY
ncbi:MAG: SsrA-binding protein SmpB [Firmicutes bacterium]|nr:SsrA-binding protein SmpB [Bacillota bacterium]